MRHSIEFVVLWATTFSYLLYGLGAGVQVWLSRPPVGRNVYGTAVARRGVLR